MIQFRLDFFSKIIDFFPRNISTLVQRTFTCTEMPKRNRNIFRMSTSIPFTSVFVEIHSRPIGFKMGFNRQLRWHRIVPQPSPVDRIRHLIRWQVAPGLFYFKSLIRCTSKTRDFKQSCKTGKYSVHI